MLDINDPFDEIIKSLNTFQPNILTGYAFALKKLAEAKNRGELNINPDILISGGEPLFFEDKEYIQKAFGKEVTNNYTSTEFLIMGIGKDSLGGMYLMEDTLYFETLPDCTLITNLFNKTLPLIRYKSSDILAKIEDSQNYYPFVKIENVVGRREMSPIFVNDLGQEDFISPHLIVEIFVEGLNAFQVVLESDRSFSFKVQYDKNITNSEKMICQEELKNRLQSILDQKKMTNVKFEIQEVEKLWVDSKTGKFKLILKNY
jgi:phenylacetate-coenzyme A ligase PaaK-like adenylate-forming protein